ncbi:hypothetical protein Fot_35417 [Forsythia ovata]|uniref:Uncharacterized protein n=1 Tax=Forsythia ovata TaxID=205694 RepID=A0ABD1SMW5_9LAMI
MMKSKGQSVNIELEIGINSKKSKRKSSISGNRTKRSKNSVQEDFEGLENVRNACCNLNEVVMNRITKIESKQSEIEAKQAEILSFQQDLKSQLNDLSGNVQNMIADFLNQIDKKFHFDTEEVVLNRQIVLYSPILETQDEFEKNDFNNYTEFETEVEVEDNDGSQLKDFEVQSQVQNDRKGKGKAVFCDETENESVHHGATEFEVEGQKKNLIDDAVSQKMCNMINFSPSFDLGIDLDTTASDIELYDMEFTDHDLKMIDETIYMRNMSTSKMAEKIEQDDDIIQIDDITPSAPRRRTRKTAAVYRSPYISEFVSSGKSKAVIREIRSCTSALRDEINAIDVNDIVDFEEWFNMGLCKNNKKKKFNDNNKMISPPFSFGILEVVDKKWFYDLRTSEECLTDTARSSSFVDWSAYDGKDPFDELDIHILGKIPQQYQRFYQ